MATEVLMTCEQSESALEALRPEWNELLRNSTCNNVFLTWEWVSAWHQVYGRGTGLRIITARGGDGRLLALAPLVIRTRRAAGVGVREISMLGAQPAAADHLDFPVRMGAEAQAVPPLVAALQRVWQSCDMLCLDGFSDASPVLTACGGVLSRWRQRREVLACPYIALPGGWDAYLGSLKSKVRSGFGRCGRMLERDNPGEVVYQCVERPDEIESGLAELVRLHQASQQGRGHAGAFADTELLRLHRLVAPEFLRQGWLDLSLLRVRGEAIAVIYAFRYGGAMWEYSRGYDPAWHKYGPGLQIQLHAIRRSIERGDHTYDMLRGAEPYKLTLTERTRQGLSLLAACRARGLLALAGQDIERGLRPCFKRVRGASRRLRQRLAPAGVEASVAPVQDF